MKRDAFRKVAAFPFFLFVIALLLVGCFEDKPGGSEVRVRSVEPAGEIFGKTNVTVSFDASVIPQENVGEAPQRPPFTITPAVAGNYKWISRDSVRFYPEAQWPGGVNYTVTVTKDALLLPNLVLAGEKAFAFQTRAFEVKKSEIRIKYVNFKDKTAKIILDLHFSYPVDPTDLKGSLALELADYGPLDFTVNQTRPDDHLTAETRPVAMSDRARKLKLKLKQPLPAAAGGMSLSAGWSRELSVEGSKSLKVESVQPSQSGDLFHIAVRFSSYITIQQLKPYVSVEPQIDTRLESSWRGFRLVGEFKPTESYTVRLKKGFIADDGAILENDFSRLVRIPDYEPSLKFSSPGAYLPLKGLGNVGVETVNLEKVKVEVFKVFSNNLVYFMQSGAGESSGDEYGSGLSVHDFGRRLYEDTLSVAAKRNERVVTPLGLKTFLEKKDRGVFVVSIRDENDYWRRDRKWIQASDLGVVAKLGSDSLHVFVNSLETLEPVPGARVRLIDRTNQELGRARTGADGVAKIADLSGNPGDIDPYLIVVEKGEDFTFLKLSDTEIGVADFEVGGRSAPEAFRYRTYLYADRGVYRPDDKAHLVAIVRKSDLKTPPSMPVKLEVLAPDQRRFLTLQGKLGANGEAAFDLEFPGWAMTGSYTARLLMMTGDELGRLSIQVEEFMPDRIKVELESDKKSYRSGETAALTTTGTMLFGPPAAGRRVRANATISPKNFRVKNYRSFVFGDSERRFERLPVDLGEGKLDENGRFRFEMEIGEGHLPPSMLEGRAFTTVTDEGGRSVSAATNFDIHPYPHYVGVKRKNDGYEKPNEPVDFQMLLVDPQGKPVAGRKVGAELIRVVWQSSLKRDERGYYRYVSEKTEESLEKKELVSGAGPLDFAFTPKQYGSYRVVLRDADGASASVSFYASGWGYAPWAMGQPDRLDIDFDKSSYKPGETAEVQVRAPFSGQLLLTVERDGVRTYKTVEMKENTARISLPVAADWTPNVYVVGTLIRSTKSLEKHAPARAYGAFPLTVDHAAHDMGLKLDSPKNMLPKRKLKVTVSAGASGGKAMATVAAVDEGILQLTGFASPDPLAWFFSKERLGVRTHDLYGLLLPELEGVKKHSDTGGGAMDDARRKNLNPVAIRRVKPVALWSGLVNLDGSGKAVVELEVPQFNGALRVMAVAFREDRFGAAQRTVTVADPIVLQPTLPRILAPEDRFTLPVSVFNKTGRDGTFTVAVRTEGPVGFEKAEQSVKIGKEKEALVRFEGRALKEAGKASFDICAEGNGRKTAHAESLAVRPARALSIESGSGVLSADKKAKIVFPGGFLKGTERPRLVISSLPGAEFGGSLQYLLTYPHGCAEQTASRAFPLLYFRSLAEKVEPELFADASVDYYVNEAIGKLESMQFSEGGFSYWPGRSYESTWSSLYASHFLVEADKAGFLVQNATLDGIFRRMRRFAVESISSGQDWEVRRGLQRRVYALYVLALLGKPDHGGMIYLKDNRLKELPSDSRYLLAAAFALAGDRKTASSLLPKKIHPAQAKRENGGNFDSSVRADAFMLLALQEVSPRHSGVAVLAASLSKARRVGRYGTTQENAMALLALGKLYARTPKADFTGTVTAGLSTLAEFDESGLTLSKPEMTGESVTLEIEGTGDAYYFWQIEGVKTEGAEKEHDVDLKVRRRYLSRDGQEVSGNRFRQGDMLVAEIRLSTEDDQVDNVVITDLLPAGLEIENPRLKSREGLEWMQPGKDAWSLSPEYMDIRDDRLVLFANIRKGKPYVFHYTLRAVTAGEFALPAVKAEAMYDPVKTSLAGSGKASVVAAP